MHACDRHSRFAFVTLPSHNPVPERFVRMYVRMAPLQLPHPLPTLDLHAAPTCTYQYTLNPLLCVVEGMAGAPQGGAPGKSSATELGELDTEGPMAHAQSSL